MTKAEKAQRILVERRLTVELAGDPARPGLIMASCRGESAEVYRLGYVPDSSGRWGCTCPASSQFHRTCAHLLALQMVVVKT